MKQARTIKRKNEMTAIDLFSGCGGLTLGLKQAGFKVVGAIEVDALASETYAINHPEVKLWHNDITTLSAKDIRKNLKLKKGELDLVAGCPPCQGFSMMRTLNGGKSIRDSRKNLVYEFMRFVEEFRPKSVMLENVPGLADDLRIQIVSSGLEKLGYHVKFDVLDASSYGVPQRRKRLILIGSRYGSVSFATPQTKQRTVRDAIFKLPRPGNTGDKAHDIKENRAPYIIKMIKKIPKDGGSRASLSRTFQLPCHKRSNGFKDVYGRMAWDKVSPTITCGCTSPSKGRFLHPTQNRAITLREAALLQSFPTKYYFSLRRGKSNAATLIGNALPPEFIRRHAKEIYKHLSRR